MNKRATMKDVARLAGVSVTTVSYVVNDTLGQIISKETIEKVNLAIKELEYVPNSVARQMRTRNAMSIGLVSFWNIKNHVFVEILEGVSKVTDQYNYTIVLCNLNNKTNSFNYIELFKRQQIDGVIFISPYEVGKGFDENEHIEKIKANKIPTVILNAHSQDEQICSIHFDYFNAAYMAVEHLVGLGHKKIGYFLPKANRLNQFQATQRLNGFKQAMTVYGLGVLDEFIFKPEELELIAQKIIEGTGPTAVVANKVEYAIDFLKKMREYDICVPKQVSVVAANDEPIAALLYPSLTTVELPLCEIGERGVQLLFENIAGRIAHVRLTLPNHVVRRDSSTEI